MSRLSALAQAIRDLPQVASKRDQLQTVKNIRIQCGPALQAIRSAERQAPFVEALADQKGKLTKLVGAAKSQMNSDARRLIDLTDRNKFGGERAISNALDSLKKAPSKAVLAIEQAWEGVRNRAGGFQEIADIADRLDVGDAQKLQKAIRDYSQSVQSPPESQADMDKIAKLKKQLEESVAGVGLEGKVRKFLMDAARGGANAKDLLDQEIGAFLTRNPELWSRLKIRLA
jgi:hypothetical protein